jgi:4-amino-4-deoxy-L-arabinose transferase-like glycosyltransferase
MPQRDTRISAAIFLSVAAVLLALHGQRMVMTNDEGIVLESAQRMAAGGRIYVDFFGYMSPGSYWLQALVFKLLGVALWTGRLIVILDFALQCALVYWLAAKLSAPPASWRAATAVTLTFAGFQVADPSFLTSAHRWDSATFALAGLCLAVSALRDHRRWKWALSGAALAAAAWCTPSLAMVAVVVALWLAISRERRSNLIPLAGGAAAIGLAGIAALMSTGSLGAFFAQMAWLRQNYSGVNVLPYGSIIGGYRGLLEGSHGIPETMVRLVLIACVALPAILPPLAILLGGVVLWKGKSSEQRAVLTLLLPAVAALAITAFPRADVMHLAFVAALPYAVVGAALASLLPARAASWLSIVSILLAAIFASNYLRGWRESSPVPSPAGTLQVARNQAPDVQRLMQQVHRGDSLFVYPYMPVQYFVTQAHNPTRYSYLMPGMMTRAQETEALGELEARPPEWLLYMQLSRQELLRVFPNGAGLDWRFAELESWMQQNYRPVEGPSVSVGGYRLWRRAPVPKAAALQH